MLNGAGIWFSPKSFGPKIQKIKKNPKFFGKKFENQKKLNGHRRTKLEEAFIKTLADSLFWLKANPRRFLHKPLGNVCWSYHTVALDFQ